MWAVLDNCCFPRCKQTGTHQPNQKEEREEKKKRKYTKQLDGDFTNMKKKKKEREENI